jgi:hypothetical protein
MLLTTQNQDNNRVKTRRQGLATPYSLSANLRAIKASRFPARPSKSQKVPAIKAEPQAFPSSEDTFNFHPRHISTPQSSPTLPSFRFGAGTPSDSEEERGEDRRPLFPSSQPTDNPIIRASNFQTDLARVIASSFCRHRSLRRTPTT